MGSYSGYEGAARPSGLRFSNVQAQIAGWPKFSPVAPSFGRPFARFALSFASQIRLHKSRSHSPDRQKRRRQLPTAETFASSLLTYPTSPQSLQVNLARKQGRTVSQRPPRTDEEDRHAYENALPKPGVLDAITDRKASQRLSNANSRTHQRRLRKAPSNLPGLLECPRRLGPRTCGAVWRPSTPSTLRHAFHHPAIGLPSRSAKEIVHGQDAG